MDEPKAVEPEQEVEDVSSELLEGQPVADEPNESLGDGNPLETPAPPQPSFADRLGELGFEGIEDDAQGQERLLQSYEQMNTRLAELERQAEVNGQLADYGRQYLDSLRQQQTPDAPPVSSPQEESWWNPPKFDAAWLERYREQSDDGQWRWKDSTPAEIRTGTEAYQAYLDQWADDLTRRPHEVLPRIIEKTVVPMFEQWYEDRRSKENEERFIDELRRENDWIYERDPRTNRPTSNFSHEGRRVMELVSEAESIGITNPRDQWQYATRIFNAEKASPQEQSKTAQDAAAEKRRQHLERAMSEPNRTGSVPTREQADDRPRNVNNRPGQELLQQMEADGVGFI